MSYSYLKNVFPKFEDSSKVYNDNLYNTLEQSQPITLSPSINENKYQEIKNLDGKDNEIVLPQTKLLENFKPENEFASASVLKHKNSSDNLHYYNLPIDQKYLPQQKQNLIQQNKNVIEQFNDEKCNLDCDLYIKHINDCNKCRSTVLKQFGIETDRIKNEEIMEVISYIVFGLFILLLIDSLKSK